MKKVAPAPFKAAKREKTLAGSSTAMERSSHSRTDTTSIAPSPPARASSGAKAAHSADLAIRDPMPRAPTASTTASTSSITPVSPVASDRVSSESVAPVGETFKREANVPPNTCS